MPGNKTHTFGRDEIVERARFESFQHGHDPQDDPVCSV